MEKKKPFKTIKNANKKILDACKKNYEEYLELKELTELTERLDKLKHKEFDKTILYEIVLWKLPRFVSVSDKDLKSINGLEKLKQGEHKNAKSVLADLLSIPGIGLPMASTILRFRNPDVFPIIDKRAYRVLYGESFKIYDKTSIYKKIETYFKYVDTLIVESKRKKIKFSDADRILYQFDKEINIDYKINDKLI